MASVPTFTTSPTLQLVHKYTETLEHHQTEGHSLNSVEEALVAQKKNESHAQSLEFWANRLEEDKNASLVKHCGTLSRIARWTLTG